jgi:hypothetical protein
VTLTIPVGGIDAGSGRLLWNGDADRLFAAADAIHGKLLDRQRNDDVVEVPGDDL